MKILGIDPGTRNLGYAILNFSGGRVKLIEAGLLKFNSSNLKEILIELSQGIDTIIDSHNIQEVAIEDIFFAYNPKTVIKLAQFRGALCLKILLEVGKYEEYTPLQVKKSLTGNGKASKEQVAFMVKKILGIRGEIRPLDITDAIAVAITHSQRLKMRG